MNFLQGHFSKVSFFGGEDMTFFHGDIIVVVPKSLNTYPSTMMGFPLSKGSF